MNTRAASLFLAAFLITCASAFSVTRTFNGTANWSTAFNWGGILPAAGDDIVINGTCTIDAGATPLPTFNSLTINATRTLTNNTPFTLTITTNATINGTFTGTGTQAASMLVITGNLTVAGPLNTTAVNGLATNTTDTVSAGGICQINTGGTITTGDNSFKFGSLTFSGGTLNFTGTTPNATNLEVMGTIGGGSGTFNASSTAVIRCHGNVDLTGLLWTPGSTRLWILGVVTVTSAGNAFACVRLASSGLNLCGALTLADPMHILGKDPSVTGAFTAIQPAAPTNFATNSFNVNGQTVTIDDSGTYANDNIVDFSGGGTNSLPPANFTNPGLFIFTGATLFTTNGCVLNSVQVNGGGTLSQGDAFTMSGNLAINANGTFSTVNKALTIDGNVTIAGGAPGGILNAGSSAISVVGNWSNSNGASGFSGGTSTVTFAPSGASATISGNTSFASFSCLAASAGKTLFFTAGTTQTVTGTFTITGAAGGQISLLSTSTTPWNLSLSTTGTGAVTWAEIQNSTATGTNTPISAIPTTNDTDLGGNTGWNFGGGSSITWGGATSTNWNLGSNWSGGRVPGATDTATVPNVGANFNPILTTNVKVSSLQVTTGTLDLSTFTLTVASATAGSFTVSGTLLLNGSQTITLGSPAVLTGSTIQYYGGGTTGLVLGNSYTNLQFAGAGTWTLNATLTVTGNLTFPSGTPTVLLAGNALNVSGNLGGTGTLTASGSEAISVGGNWTVGTFNPSFSTVTFNGTGAQSASPATFSAVVLTKTAGSFTATSAFNAASLTTGPSVAFAVSLAAGGSITGAGATTFSNTGTLTIGAGFTFNNGVAAGPGPSAYSLSGTIQNTASSVMNFGAATTTLTGNTIINSNGGAITIAVVNAQGAGVQSLTLNAGAGAVNLSGAIGATQLNNLTVTSGAALAFPSTSLTGVLTASAGGAVTQTGAITQTGGGGSSSFTTGAFPITLTTVGNSFVGPVSLNNSGANNVALTTSGALSLAASGVGSGTLTVIAGGAITQTGAISQAVGALGSSFTTGAFPITLTQANDLVGPVSLTNSGLNNVVVTNGANPLQIGTLSLGTGTFTVNAVGITQTATAITVPGAATFNGGAGVITLNTVGNNFQSTVALNNSGANNVALTTSGALSLAASGVGSGTLTVIAGGAITQTGAITQAAGGGTATFNAGAGAITLTTATNSFTGAVSLNNTGANNVALTNSGALALAASGVGSGTLTVIAGGAITQTGAITQAVGALGSSFTTGAFPITLTQANDLVGPVSLTNSGLNNVVVTNGANPLQIGTLSLGTGTFTVNAVGITQTATAITVPGAATFNGGAGVITLNTVGNNFQSTVALNNSGANNVALTTSGALSLAASGVGSGTLALIAGGAITQTGAITQAVGALGSSFTTGAFPITLTQANDLVGPVSLTNSGLNNVVVTNGANPLQIGTLSLGTGTFTVNAVGITQTATAITVPGAATFNGGAGVITLNTVGNNFQSTVALNNSGANNVALTTSGALSLAASGVGSGTLTVIAGGAITQTGAITQAVGALGSSFTTGAFPITLTQANDLVGPVSLTNSGLNNVVVTNGTNPLQIGTLSLGTGTFTVNAVGITQTATAITVPGAATFNGGAGVITLNTVGNNFQSTVALNNSGANNVALTTSGALSLAASGVGSGTLTVIAGGAITQTGAITQAVGALGSSFTTGAFPITLTTAGNSFVGPVALNNSGANNVALTTSGALSLAASGVGSGTLALIAGGAITQTGAISQAVGALGSSFTTGAFPITLTQANDLVGPVSLTNSGLNNVVVTNGANPLQIGTLSLGTGTFTVNAVGITQTATAITVPGAATFNGGAGVITLNTVGNNFQSTVALNNSGANNVALTTSGALSLAASGVGSGTLTVIAGGAITQTGAITQAVGALGSSFTTGAFPITLTQANDLVGPVSLTNSGLNNVVVTNGTNPLQIGTLSLGTGTFTVNAVGITQTATAITVPGAATFNGGAGVITLNTVGNNFQSTVALNNSGANNVALTTSGALSLAASGVGSGTLTVIAGGAITQTGAITQAVGALGSSFTTGAFPITLTTAGNSFVGPVALNNSGANNVALTTSGALSLAASGVGSGTLTVIAGGAITQTGAITQAVGALGSSFTTGAFPITLTQANDLVGPVSLTNSGLNNVVVTNGANPLQIGTLSLGTGTFTVNAVGITQTATAITVPGAATFNGGAGVITLNTVGNNFQSTVALNNSGANNVALTTSGALSLAASGVGSGTLTVIAGGAITQTGAITQAVGALGSSFTTGAFPITLTQANDLVGPVSLTNSGLNNVVVTNGTNPLQIGTLSLGTGTFTVNAVGITQTATAITVPGAATFNGGAGVITLNTVGNNFQSTVALNNSGANNVALTTSGALSLAASGVGSGTLTVIAGGAITQTGAITQAVGALGSSFTTGAFPITLTTAGNSFVGPVALNNSGANNVALTTSGALSLAASGVGSGTLTVIAGGAITQTGAITQAVGALGSSFTTGAFPITLTTAGNSFVGPVALNNSGANNVALTTSGALSIAASSVGSGTLTVIGGGAITQTGAITQAGGAGSVILSPGAGNSVTLGTAANSFTGSVSVTNGSAVTLVDSIGLDLGPITITGSLAATAVTGNITNAGGTLTIGGNSTFTANAAGASISVAHAGNTFSGTVTFLPSGGGLANVTVLSTLALDLQALSLSGNLTVTSPTMTQSGAVSAGGNITLAGGTLTMNGNNLTAGGSLAGPGLTATASELISVGANWNVTTFTYSTNTPTVQFTGTGFIQTPTTFYNLTISATAIDTLQANITINNTLNLSGTLNAGSFSITMNGPTWNNVGGTFNGGTGTVTFLTTVTLTINGNNNWYNFTCLVDTKTIKFQNLMRQTIMAGGNFNVHASGPSTPIVLTTTNPIATANGSPPPTLQGQWMITDNSMVAQVIDNINVSWSYATVAITPGPGAFDGGNNFGWNFVIPIVASWTLDTDNNGRIDRIRVQVTPGTQLSDNFGNFVVQVQGYSVTGYAPVGANTDVFDVRLQEGPQEDTNATPTWQVTTNTTLYGLVGGALVAHNTTSPSVTKLYVAASGAQPGNYLYPGAARRHPGVRALLRAVYGIDTATASIGNTSFSYSVAGPLTVLPVETSGSAAHGAIVTLPAALGVTDLLQPGGQTINAALTAVWSQVYPNWFDYPSGGVPATTHSPGRSRFLRQY